MFKLVKYLKGYIAASVCAPLFKFMEALFELILPIVVAQIIDVGIAQSRTAYIWQMGAVMLALGAAGYGFSTLCQLLAAKASLGYGTNLRSALYKHINTLSYAELDKFGSASLITRLTSDINYTQQTVAMFIRLVTRAPFILIGSIVMAIMINLKLSLIFLGAAIIVSLILLVIMLRSVPYYKKMQKGLDKVSRLTQENLSGARVVKAFSKEPEEQADFKEASDSLNETGIKVGRISALLNPLTYAVINFSVALIIWLGGKTVYYGDLTQGEIIALVNYLNQILLVLVVLANLVVIFTKASASAARINEVFAVQSSLAEGGGAKEKADAPAVKFKDVSFSYGDDVGNSLENISFEVARGNSLGIIGGTGSGKTTLVNLIARFYDCEGVVEICGADVKDYTFGQLRKKIAVVPQKTSLFYGTIRDNLKMANPEATDEQLWAALETAQAAEFVRKYAEGLDKLVLAKGRNLSGGQKQRLAVARAVAANAEILILDDSASALDYSTDARLRRALAAIEGLTLIVVSQRTNSIMRLDDIIVLEEGRISAHGSHEELLKSCSAYSDLFKLQSGGAL